MKTLVIAEKPSVGRDIARVLQCTRNSQGALEGEKYIVTWALGHLVTLADPEGYDAKYKSWRIEDLPMMPQHFKLVVIKQTHRQFQIVKNQLLRKDVGTIVIATDAGREGELVARWILKIAGNKKPVKRLWISSVTDKAIREGFKKSEGWQGLSEFVCGSRGQGGSRLAGGNEWNKGIDMSLQCTAFLWPRSDTDIGIDRIQRAGDQILCA